MKPTKPLGLSLSRAVLLLLLLYLAVVVDVVTGLNLNLYGYGREPLLFALGAVVVASTLYLLRCVALGMIGLVFCCAWLVLYPAKNGFDGVLSPLLVTGILMWIAARIWHKQRSKP